MMTRLPVTSVQPCKKLREGSYRRDQFFICNNILLITLIFICLPDSIQRAKKYPSPVREKGIFWSDVSVFSRPAILVCVAVLPRLVVIIPLTLGIATFFGQKNNKFLNRGFLLGFTALISLLGTLFNYAKPLQVNG